MNSTLPIHEIHHPLNFHLQKNRLHYQKDQYNQGKSLPVHVYIVQMSNLHHTTATVSWVSYLPAALHRTFAIFETMLSSLDKVSYCQALAIVQVYASED